MCVCLSTPLQTVAGINKCKSKSPEASPLVLSVVVTQERIVFFDGAGSFTLTRSSTVWTRRCVEGDCDVRGARHL